eukprot:CAMPEP_0201494426 /NCGR_PEP_ID=MMETSP0151_2-20130828/47323_1 /ASSEMBLY_ACC=CAM_ASM_000257 /TAXON_ID=200890 /ORGANISM="Paramoeba atlantica, Strain 621/1 / CCAP 1560/9" /LENGTH=107 /DNA_ID=CAMNT_0047882661 /DNA_START=42 /DNA_END=365 /DNA_ORIENTATION=+
MSLTATPRINGEMLPQYINQTVRIMGQIMESSDGAIVNLQASDNRMVKVKTEQPLELPSGTVVEIIGKVGPDQVVQELSTTVAKGDFHFQNYEQVLQLSHRYKELFY